ncbi:aldo/keto reductase [Streptomyces scopuliridis]|uniref:aldo/keto reductase n=1 Tax=Streptomyces scopuliridis TaxID=452529 RepID=UPI003420FB00
MREAGTGTLLYTTGAGSIDPVPEVGNVNTAAAALRNWAVNLHKELACTGVQAAHVGIDVSIGVLSYSPLANGWLSGRALAQNLSAKFDPPMFDTTDPANAHCAELVAALAEVADEAGIPLPRMATAFTRAHPAITSVIIGPRTPTSSKT